MLTVLIIGFAFAGYSILMPLIVGSIFGQKNIVVYGHLLHPQGHF